MAYVKDKADDMTLALLYPVMHGGRVKNGAWNGCDRETMNRLRKGASVTCVN